MDEILDIFEVMMPKKMVDTMILLRIKITKLDSLDNLVKFCEHLKVMEEIYQAHQAKPEAGHNAKLSQYGRKKETSAFWSVQVLDKPLETTKTTTN